MAIYRFRTTIEDQEEISRDLEIRPSQTFEDLHFALHQAFGFDGHSNASFFMSDDNWKKGTEITFRELSEEDASQISSARSARLCDFILDPHQKIYYELGPDGAWSFHLELFKIIPQEDILATYPRCSRTVGEAPPQYKNVAAGSIPIPEDFDEDELEDEEDDDREETIMGTDASELPEGEERVESFIASDEDSEEGSEEMETADEELLDEDGAESDEY